MKPDDAQRTKEETGMDRLGEAFQLDSNGLYKASVAAEICKGFYYKHDRLTGDRCTSASYWLESEVQRPETDVR